MNNLYTKCEYANYLIYLVKFINHNLVRFIFAIVIALSNDCPLAETVDTLSNSSNIENTEIPNNKFITSLDTSRNYFNKALLLVKAGNHQAAISLLDLAIRLDPKYVDAYVARASIEEKNGNLKSALLDYSYALNIKQSDKIYYQRGTIEFALKAFPEAIRDFTAAIELNPLFARAYNQRGLVFFANNMLSEAKNDFIRAYELNDKILSALEKIGEINISQGNLEQALENFNKIIAIKPDDARAYFNRAKVFEFLQMHDKSLKDYNMAIELNKHLEDNDPANNDQQVNSHSI